MRYLGLLVSSLALAACSSSAVLTELNEDGVIVEARFPNPTHVQAEASRGCAFHGRTAVSVSKQCLDQTCSTQRFVFACRGAERASRGRSSPWLGISVDDVADHLYADPPGTPEVVISRVYADGPGKIAGLRVGDIIETFDGVPVTTARMLADLKRRVQIGRQVPIDVRRGTSVQRFLITPVE
jgi:predicted metalloprotease with PDZ domain